MLAKIRTKEDKAGHINGDAYEVDYLDSILQTESRYQVILELGGLVKCFGFPIIDPITSGESSRDYGRAPDRTRPYRELLSEQVLSHLLLVNYIRKHGVWPPMRFSERRTELKRLHGLGWLSVTWDSYPLTDWAHARFSKFVDFDYMDDYLPLLKDKSCSVLRSQLQDTYDGTLTDRSIRRLLKQALDQSEISTRKEMNDYAQNRISRDEYMILEYPKLKEFKVEARMFCMLTLRMRLIFSIIQENVKHGLFDYLPYTSMTMSRAELERELLKMTSPATRGETLFVEVDLSRWNLCFRDAVISRLGGVMDDVFGVNNIFGRFHEFCRQSEVMVLVGDSRVSVLEPDDRERRMRDQCPNYFTGHLGGFEGIDQATWTVATICMIQQALLGESVTFKLLGQGDNQTLAIRRKPGNVEPITTLSERILRKIDEVCDELNHEAKPEEFVDSLSQLTYSKNAYVNGASVPQELKPVSKVAPITSTDICTFGDAVGALFSGTIGSSANSRVPERHWLLGMMLAETLFDDAKSGLSPFLSAHVNPLVGDLSLLRKKLLLTVPSVLGGLPVSPSSAYLCRGEPDPLTAAISSFRVLAQHDVTLRGYMSVLFSNATYQRRPQIANLLRDPFSLPFHTSLLPASVMADTALGIVRQSRNVHVRELLGEADTDARAEFITALMSTRPCFPTVLRDIYDVSAHGKLEEMSKMFTLTRTFVNAAKGGSENVEQRVWAAERKRNILIGMRFRLACSAPQRVPSLDPSHVLASELRSRWGLGQNTIQGIECVHPFDFPLQPGAPRGSGVRFVSRADMGDPHGRRGPMKAYLGSRTAERRVETDWDVKRTPASNEIKRLILAYSAGSSDDAVESHVKYALAQRTGEPLEGLLQALPTTQGGALAHRYQSLRDAGGIRPNGNPMITTHVAFSSDHVEGVSGGEVDYPVAFQQFFAIGLGLARILAQSPDSPLSFSIRISAADMTPLAEDRFTAQPITAVPRTLPHNPLLYVPALEGVSRGERPPRERVVTVREIQNDPEIADETLSSALTILLLKRSITSARLELDEESVDESSRPLTLDVAVVTAMGVLRVYRACVRAAVAAGPRFYMRVVGKAPHRYSLYALAYNLAGILTPVVSQHLSRVDATPLVAMGAWVPSSSISAHGTALSSLRRALTADVFTQLTVGTPQHSRLIVPPTTAHITEEEVLALEISTVLFAVVSLHEDTSMGEGKRALRDMIRKMREVTSSVATSVAAREVLVQGLFDVLASSPTFGQKAKDLEVLSWLSEPGRSFNCPLETAVRALRAPNHPRTRTRPVGEPLFHNPTHGDSSGKLLWHDQRSDGLQADTPRTLPPVPPRSPSDIILSGGSRVVGYTTRVASYWSEVVEKVPDPVLVIGTGAGGIQSALCACGKVSRGLDLQSTVDAILGEATGVPPEVLAMGYDLAKYSSATFTTSGDFQDPLVLAEALAEERFRCVIVDVESPGLRLAIEPFRALALVGYFGEVWTKSLCTRQEAAAIWSALGESTGITRIGAYQLDLGPGGDGLSQIAFGVRLAPTILIPERYTPRGEFRGTRTRLPSPRNLDRWCDTLPAKIRAVCGQFIDTETRSFHDARAQLALACHEARGKRRGSLSSNIYLGVLRSWGISVLADQCATDDSLDTALLRLSRSFDLPRLRIRAGNLHVDLDLEDQRIRHALLRRLPHALATIFLEREARTGGS